jgi:hypothetical protein
VGFLLGSFFIILAPTSSFAPIIDLSFEHRMYLPLAPLAVLGVLGGRAGLQQLSGMNMPCESIPSLQRPTADWPSCSLLLIDGKRSTTLVRRCGLNATLTTSTTSGS